MSQDRASFLQDGNFVIAYEDSDGNGTSIVYDILDANGVNIDGAAILNDPGSDVLGDPSITVAADNSFLVTFQRDDGANVTTEVVKVSSAGVVGAPVTAITGSEAGFQTDVTTLTNGTFVVVSLDAGADDAITFRRIGADGTPIGGATFVNSTNSNGDADGAPTVTALTDGGFVVAWQNTDASDTDIQFQIYNSLGATVGAVQTVSSDGALDDNRTPELIGLSDGGFVIVHDDDEGSRIKLQRFDATGAEVGTEVTVNISDFESRPRVSLSDDGRLLVGWTITALSDNDVEFEILDPREAIIGGDNTSETIASRIDGAIVNGLGGDDTLLGQAADELNGGSGEDTIRGGSDDDLLQGGLNGDTIFGDEGDDTIFGNTQADSDGSVVGDTMFGGDGDDEIIGSGDDDTIDGGADDDLLTGGVGDDTQVGGGGEDTFVLATGKADSGESIDGGAGSDRILALSDINLSSVTLASI